MLSPEFLQRRCHLLQELRSFFFSRQYVEVDTPVRQPVLLPESQIRPIAADGWFLQSSPEQCMKRLLAQGNSRIFQVCPCFRKDERGRLHNEEFTMLEWYHSGWDYFALMKECEELLGALTLADRQYCGKSSELLLVQENRAINLQTPWPRISVHEAFLQYAGIDPVEALAKDIFDQLLVEQIEPHLGWEKPVFLIDYPVDLASLARKKTSNPQVAERFELYIGGIELANGFSELVDPAEQEKRFLQELLKVETEKAEVQKLPVRFLKDLQSLEDCAGIALGLDRLFLVLWGGHCLDEVMTFSNDDLAM